MWPNRNLTPVAPPRVLLSGVCSRDKSVRLPPGYYRNRDEENGSSDRPRRQDMLKLHFAPNSRAGRIVWLLEELGLEYEVNKMAFHPKDLKSEEHRARHPHVVATGARGNE